jgi:hypothetical protein
MFDKIFAKKQSLKSQIDINKEGLGRSGNCKSETSNRVAKPQNASVGACPLEDPDYGDKASLDQSTSTEKTLANV